MRKVQLKAMNGVKNGRILTKESSYELRGQSLEGEFILHPDLTVSEAREVGISLSCATATARSQLKDVIVYATAAVCQAIHKKLGWEYAH
ncbi:hypothetical protein KFS98_003700 [Salmonella enterica]|nr:hypothetical protein [Salmonella enterica]